MRPIGLKFRNPELNPITGKISGELIIVHRCIGCGFISCNRIAGDDNPPEIIKLLEISDTEKSNNKKLLTNEDKNEVLSALFGYNYQDPDLNLHK